MGEKEKEIMQKQKKQLFAVVAVLLLFIGAYVLLSFYNDKQEEKDTAKAEADKIYVTDVKAKDITAFSYQYNSSTLTFTKAEDTWNSTEESGIDLDESKIETLLSNLEKLEAEEVVENPDELSKYGFDAPTNVITFTTEEGTVTLTVGMKNEITDQYYVTMDGSEKLYLTSTVMPTAFEKSVADLVVESTETEVPTETEAIQETEATPEAVPSTEEVGATEQ